LGAYEIRRTNPRSEENCSNKKPASGKKQYRNLLLFSVGINSALRISDLLQLKIGYFVNQNGQIRKRFTIKERKRGKRQDVFINESIQDSLREYMDVYPHITQSPDNYLFFNPKTQHPLKRGQAWKFISSICGEVGLQGNFGTVLATFLIRTAFEVFSR